LNFELLSPRWHELFVHEGMKSFPLKNTVLTVFLLFMIVCALYFGKPFFVPFAIAGILSMLFLPVSRRLEKSMSRGFAAITCILLLVVAVAAVFGLVAWQVNTLAEDEAKLRTQVKEQVQKLKQTIDTRFGIPPEQQQQKLQQQSSGQGSKGMSIISSLFSLVVDTIIVLVYIFFLMLSRSHIKQSILKMCRPANKKRASETMTDITEITHQYLSGLGMMIVCLWVMYGIGFSIVGVKNALFFAVLCGLLEIIPFIGNITGTTITILMALAQGGGMNMVIGIVVVYAIVQFIQGNVLEPLIVGPKVNVNAISTIIALVIGELIWGIPGVVLAIPFLAITKVICDHVDGLQPIGFLIGTEEKEPKGVKRFFTELKKRRS
jgi:predicted PurR-regulated permease PerM